MTKRLYIFLALLLLGLPVRAGAAQPSFQRDLLVVTDTAPVTTLDPLQQVDQVSRRFCEQVYEHLVSMDGPGRVRPLLAREWKQVGSRTWRFTLRRGVRFHNGERLDAAAVVFSLERVKNSPQREVLPLKRVRALGTYQVEVEAACPDLLPRLAYAGYIVPPGHTRRVGLASRPVGTGPYRFVSRDQGGIHLAYFSGYWNRGPGFRARRLLINQSSDQDQRLRWMLSSQSQVMFNLNPHLKATLLRYGAPVRLYSQPSSREYFIVINPSPRRPQNQQLLSNPGFRRALNLAVDAERIIRVILLGNGIILDGVLNPRIRGYHPQKVIPYDPVAARRAIRRWAPHGAGFTLAVPRNRYPLAVAVARATARYLENAGLKMRVEEVDWPEFLDKVVKKNTGDWDMYYLGWGNPLLEASYTLHPGFGSSPLCRTCPPDMENLLRRAFQLSGPERYRLYARIQDRLRRAAPWIFLFQGVDNYASSRDVMLSITPSETFRVFYDLQATPEDL